MPSKGIDFFHVCKCSNPECGMNFKMPSGKNCPPICPSCTVSTWQDDDEGRTEQGSRRSIGDELLNK